MEKIDAPKSALRRGDYIKWKSPYRMRPCTHLVLATMEWQGCCRVLYCKRHRWILGLWIILAWRSRDPVPSPRGRGPG